MSSVEMEEAIQFAKKYIENLLSFFGLNIDVYATTEDDEVIELHVPSTHLNGFLIGQRGETMRAIQYVISMALKHGGYEFNRVNVDVADYKKNRAERLLQRAEEWFKDVNTSGKPKELQAMSAAERRIIHKAATDFGIETESVGEGRDRHIILKPVETETKAEPKKAAKKAEPKEAAEEAEPPKKAAKKTTKKAEKD